MAVVLAIGAVNLHITLPEDTAEPFLHRGRQAGRICVYVDLPVVCKDLAVAYPYARQLLRYVGTTQKRLETQWFPGVSMELLTRFELVTSSLPRTRSAD